MNNLASVAAKSVLTPVSDEAFGALGRMRMMGSSVKNLYMKVGRTFSGGKLALGSVPGLCKHSSRDSRPIVPTRHSSINEIRSLSSVFARQRSRFPACELRSTMSLRFTKLEFEKSNQGVD